MNFGTIQVADIFVGALNAIEAYFGTEKVWEKSAPPTPPTGDWLCFTAEEANSTVTFGKVGSPNTLSLEKSTDGNNWKYYYGEFQTLANVGDKLYIRARTTNTTISSSADDYYNFHMTGKIAASGNIQTLLTPDGSRTDVPAYCYYNMFWGCSSLTTAPALPATTLAGFCYAGMFQDCTSLTTAPSLPATTLADNCYGGMFNGCSALTSAPELPATTLAQQCYVSMFYNCTSLTTAPTTLPALTLYNLCYANMFEGCSSLTKSPYLLSTTLGSASQSSCLEMFKGCSSLSEIKIAYTGSFGWNSGTTGWVNGVAASGTFYYNGSSTTRGPNAIPSGWTITPFTP